jgi:hypothetical protein
VLNTTEFTLTVRLSYKIKRRDTGEELETRTVEGTTSYYTNTNTTAGGVAIGNTPEGERQAMPLALQDAATRLVGQLSEGW